MRSSKILPRLGGLVLAAFLLAGCGLSLAEDVTPPPNYRPPQQQAEQPAAAETVFPILPPDPTQGAALYGEKCAPCHGATGMGDGPQAGNLPYPAAPIGNRELARQSRPVDWYRIVTVGNLERLMPGFSGSMSDRQRWDVVAYVYTLSTDAQELAQGKELYDANCAECHGDSGGGDGPQAAALAVQPASWKDQARLAERSAADLVDLMLSGSDQMHAFSGELDETQAYAAAAYIRTLSFAGPVELPQQAAAQPTAEPVEAETAAPAETPAADATEAPPATQATGSPEDQQLSTITVTGQITNGTPGGAVPEGLEVKLLAFSEMARAFELTVPAEQGGAFAFEDVEFQPAYVYYVTVDSGGLTFNSDILHGRDVLGEMVELPVQIYDTTTDPSALRTERLHVFFDFTQPDKVQVVNLFVIANSSEQVVIGSGPTDPVVEFDLPQGAENLQFQDSVLGERYVQTENGFGDTAPVQPGMMGAVQVLFAYDLPYDGSLDYEMTMPLDVEAATVMIPTAGVELTSDQLIDQGAQTAQGMSFRSFQAMNSFATGETLAINLRGAPGAPGAALDTGNLAPLLIGVGAFGAVLAGAGFWLYRQRKSQAEEEELADGEEGVAVESESEEDSETIIDAIVALDDRHAAGELPEAAYRQRRAELKARLAEALAREDRAASGKDE